MKSARSTIAVVDDELSVRTALGRLLRLADYDVVAFESGEAFLAALAGNPPDCVVLDVHLPGLSGIEVQARMSAERKVPAVFITASDDPAIGDAALRSGVPLLRKPFPNTDLLEAVGMVLGHPPLEVL